MAITEFDAGSGALVAASTSTQETTALSTFGEVALGRIALSPTNPRRLHDRDKLLQLLGDRKALTQVQRLLKDQTAEAQAELVKALGGPKFADFVRDVHVRSVKTPVSLRPLPSARLAETVVQAAGKQRPDLELVAGERRVLASLIAGKTMIRATVETMSDQEALEFQLVENLQRDDLHPLEEAEGYQRLCEATGITKEDIGGKIGKSRSYVYARLKLLTLTQESRDAFRAGKLDVSRAEMLATVADPKLQVKALKTFVEVDYNEKPMSVRQCATWLEQNILLKLKDAPFDTKDETLLASGCPPHLQGTGACTGCPKRTHANRDLFAAFEGPDMCIDPPCFHAKEAAHLQRIKDEAAAQGMEVIAGKDARKLKPHAWGDDIKGYTRLDAKHDDGTGKEVSLGKLIGRDATPALFVDPHTHKKVKVLPTEVVGQLLKEKGLVKSTEAERDRKREAALERERAKVAIDDEYRLLSVDTIAERIRDGALCAFSAPVLRLVLQALLGTRTYGSNDRDAHLMRLWHLPAIDGDGYSVSEDRRHAVMRHIAAVHDEALGPMVLHVLLVSNLERSRYNPATGEHTNDTPAIDLLADETGVDLKAILADVQARHKEAAKAAKAAATPGATRKAAPQGSDAHEEGEVDAEPPARVRGGRRRKLSAQEAQSGIADAMQSVEGQEDEAGEDPHGLQVGFVVCVRDKPPKSKRQWAGQEGEIVEIRGDLITLALGGEAKPVTFNRSDLALEEATADA